jgi:hypothetical protein
MEAKGGTFGDLLHCHGCLLFTIALCARDGSDGWSGEATGRMEREVKGGDGFSLLILLMNESLAL